MVVKWLSLLVFRIDFKMSYTLKRAGGRTCCSLVLFSVLVGQVIEVQKKGKDLNTRSISALKHCAFR